MNKAKEGRSTIASGVRKKKTMKMKLAQMKNKATRINSRSLKSQKLPSILTRGHFLDCV